MLYECIILQQWIIVMRNGTLVLNTKVSLTITIK